MFVYINPNDALSWLPYSSSPDCNIRTQPYQHHSKLNHKPQTTNHKPQTTNYKIQATIMPRYTTTTHVRRGMFGRKKPVVVQHRKPTMKDKISGALLRLKGSLTRRRGQKVCDNISPNTYT